MKPRRLAALGLLLAACASAALLSRPAPAPKASAEAWLLVSSNTRDDMDIATARAQLDMPEHRHYRAVADDILRELGVRGHRVEDALGDWDGSAENSFFVSLDGPADPVRLRCAAAWFGLAARQKAVLAFHADPRGGDVMAMIDFRGRSLVEVRTMLDRAGFRDRTLVRRHGGWLAVVVAEGDRRQELQRLPANVRLRRGRSLLIGEATQDGARQRYREVIATYGKACAAEPLAKKGW